MRIAILDTNDIVRAFMDNKAPAALQFWGEKFHRYIEGNTYTLTFSADAKHVDSQYLVVGGKLSFTYKGRDYYLNIMQVVNDEHSLSVTAYGTVFELLNQTAPKLSLSGKTFEEYLKAFKFADIFTIGINEISKRTRSIEWTSTATVLNRIYSLATNFDAEVEILARLNEHYGLDGLILNIYIEHDSEKGVQGVGTDRTNEIIRYGREIDGIERTIDITDLITCVIPTGKDGLNIRNIPEQKIYDADGNLEYHHVAGNRGIFAVKAKNEYPSNTLKSTNDRYISIDLDYDTSNANTLYSQGLTYLKKNSVPRVTYSVSGYVDAEIGDTFTVEDSAFSDTMYLEARVVEQEISFTDPTANVTTFDNFFEKRSEISGDILDKVNKLIEANRGYTIDILSTKTESNIVLSARVSDGQKDVTTDFSESFFKWYKITGTELIQVGAGYSFTVEETQAVYRLVLDDLKGT